MQGALRGELEEDQENTAEKGAVEATGAQQSSNYCEKGAATKQPNLQGHLHRAGQHYKQERNKNYKPLAALTLSATSPADTSSKGL